MEYFYARVAGAPDKAYGLLGQLAEEDISLLAFSAVPYGDGHVELTLFPDESGRLVQAAGKLGWNLTGPQHAVLIQGDDQLGALADIHNCLNESRVTVYASSGVTDGSGRFGYVIYIREEDHAEAARAIALAVVRG